MSWNPVIKNKKDVKTDETLKKAIHLLKKTAGNNMKLNDLVQGLIKVNPTYHKTEIYNAIRDNPSLFKKEITTSRYKIVSLLNSSDITKS